MAPWSRSLEAAASRGRVVVIGPDTELKFNLNFCQLLGRNLSIESITRVNRSAMEGLVQLAGQGKLQ